MQKTQNQVSDPRRSTRVHIPKKFEDHIAKLCAAYWTEENADWHQNPWTVGEALSGSDSDK